MSSSERVIGFQEDKHQATYRCVLSYKVREPGDIEFIFVSYRFDYDSNRVVAPPAYAGQTFHEVLNAATWDAATKQRFQQLALTGTLLTYIEELVSTQDGEAAVIIIVMITKTTSGVEVP